MKNSHLKYLLTFFLICCLSSGHASENYIEKGYQESCLVHRRLPAVNTMIDNSFEEDNIESEKTKVRPLWNNQDIQPRLKTILNDFYFNKTKPKFLEDFKLMLKNNRSNANKQLSVFFNQLNIIVSADEIENIFKQFNIINLRPLINNKLILSCGNYITDSEHKYYPDHRNKDVHQDADTVDRNISMNPSIVADLSSIGFYEYLSSLNKKYDTIIAEGGYTLHGSTGFEKLRKILNMNGVYEIRVGSLFNIVNVDQNKDFDKLKNDQYFFLPLFQEKYQEILSKDLKNIQEYLLSEMNKFYKENGFNFQIQHPEFFIVSRVDDGKDEKNFHTYCIGRIEIEASNITLVRFR